VLLVLLVVLLVLVVLVLVVLFLLEGRRRGAAVGGRDEDGHAVCLLGWSRRGRRAKGRPQIRRGFAAGGGRGGGPRGLLLGRGGLGGTWRGAAWLAAAASSSKGLRGGYRQERGM
jgi:hypothetical protein